MLFNSIYLSDHFEVRRVITFPMKTGCRPRPSEYARKRAADQMAPISIKVFWGEEPGLAG